MEELSFPCALAFYGSLMRGLGGLDELGICEAVRFLGPCEIEGRLIDLGPYPGLVRGAGRVLGELHEVQDAGTLALLDRFEGFDFHDPPGSLYLRERVRLLAPDRKALVYVYNRSVSGRREVVSGDWRAHLCERGG